MLSSPHKYISTCFCAVRVLQGKHPRSWYSRSIGSYPTEDGAEMPFHAVPGHQSHLTLRGVTFSAGSRASRPRWRSLSLPCPSRRRAPAGIPPRPPSGGQLTKPHHRWDSIFPLARYVMLRVFIRGSIKQEYNVCCNTLATRNLLLKRRDPLDFVLQTWTSVFYMEF